MKRPVYNADFKMACWKRANYLRCLQRAMFNSVISPVPEILLISRSFLPMANAVIADGLPGFVVTNGLGCTDDF